jgi:hypothetical protein
MKLSDGHVLVLGDHVTLDGKDIGVVVCSIDTNEYTIAYPASQWDYLKSGVLVEFPAFGLIHYVDPEPDLRLADPAKP